MMMTDTQQPTKTFSERVEVFVSSELLSRDVADEASGISVDSNHYVGLYNRRAWTNAISLQAARLCLNGSSELFTDSCKGF